MFKFIKFIVSIIGVALLITPSSALANEAVYSKNEIEVKIPDIITNPSGTVVSVNDGGGGVGIYVEETKVAAPWLLPDSIVVERYINGRKYSGRLYYKYSIPLPSLGVEFPAHVLVGIYGGVIY